MHTRAAFVLLALLLALSACGDGAADNPPEASVSAGGNQGTEPSNQGSEPKSPSNDNQGGGNPGGLPVMAGGVGSFVVDGESFDDIPVARCEPIVIGGPENEDDLSLVALVASMEGLQVEISNADGFAMGENEMITYSQQSLSVSYSRSGDAGIEQFSGFASNDIDNIWYLGGAPLLGQEGTAMESPPFTRRADSISGTMTLEQDYPEDATGSVEISFDFEIPSAVVDCST